MVDINNPNNEAQRRAEAFQTLEDTLPGVDEEVKKRDWAYHMLIDTSHTREDWEEVSECIRVARKCGDLRPAVRAQFGARCPYDELAKRVFVDEPPKQKFPPVTAVSVLKAMRKEQVAKRRKKQSPRTA